MTGDAMTGTVKKRNIRTMEIEGVGPVVFRRTRRARSINITVTPFKEVSVALPGWASYGAAEEAVKENLEWIREQAARMREWEEERLFSPDLPFDMDADRIRGMLESRTRELAGRYGFRYGRVTVRNQKTRWGSCSPSDNISLNAKLAWLPDELADYVILHELMHTRVKNHGKMFWAALDRIVGDAKALDKRLREYHLELL